MMRLTRTRSCHALVGNRHGCGLRRKDWFDDSGLPYTLGTHAPLPSGYPLCGGGLWHHPPMQRLVSSQKSLFQTLQGQVPPITASANRVGCQFPSCCTQVFGILCGQNRHLKIPTTSLFDPDCHPPRLEYGSASGLSSTLTHHYVGIPVKTLEVTNQKKDLPQMRGTPAWKVELKR